MKIIQILAYGLGLMEFPYDDTKGNCKEQANLIFQTNGVKHYSTIDVPEFWAEGDYWLGEDGKRYRLAGFRCVDKETNKEIR